MAEYRTYGDASIRSEETDDGRIIFTGYVAKFDDDSKELREHGLKFVERISKGAFKRSIDGGDVKMLVNHDKSMVMGRTGVAKGEVGSLSLSEDEVGLRFECVATDTSYARDLKANMDAGVIDSCSFGFRKPKYKSSRRSDGKLVRELQDCELFDASIVTYPAYNSTVAQSRSLDEVYEELEAELEGSDDSTEMPPVGLLRKKLELKKKEL